ncbi:MAG TPA: hypothetical protein VGF17_12710 [Phytomonospora sp.]
MPVLLADRQLTAQVRSHPQARDARGVPMPSAADTLTSRGPYPGAAKEQPDTSWRLRLDERCWPLRGGDQITDGTLTWVVSYNPEPKLHQVPGVPDVDYVEVVATLDPPRVP